MIWAVLMKQPVPTMTQTVFLIVVKAVVVNHITPFLSRFLQARPF